MNVLVKFVGELRIFFWTWGDASSPALVSARYIVRISFEPFNKPCFMSTKEDVRVTSILMLWISNCSTAELILPKPYSTPVDAVWFNNMCGFRHVRQRGYSCSFAPDHCRWCLLGSCMLCIFVAVVRTAGHDSCWIRKRCFAFWRSPVVSVEYFYWTKRYVCV